MQALDFFKGQVETIRAYLPEIHLELNWKDVTKMTGGVLVGVTIIYCGKIWYAHQYFKRMGIKTPPACRFISGNYHEIIQNNYSDQLRAWTQLLGPLYGYYEGHLPVLVSSDPDFLQEVFIKQFGNFVARKRTAFQTSDDSPELNLILSTKGRWKRMRNIINPTFSTAKLKELMPLMHLCTDRLVDEISKSADQEINIKVILSRFTMDMICNCAFGLDIDCLNNPEAEFLVRANQLFDQLTTYKMAILYAFYFYELKPVLVQLSKLSAKLFGSINRQLANPLWWIRDHIQQVLDIRTASKVQRKDYVQILLESQSEQVNKDNDTSSKIDFTQTKLEKKMTIQEIKLNMVTFMLAGYDTTSNTLTYCSYILATHPEEMTKLQEEIDAKFADIEPDYDSVNDLPYLDMFIKETLRMFPLASNVINRRCMTETTIKGVKIPAGLVVAADALTLHYDPEHWGPVDPNLFYPLRFSPEIKRHQCVYMPFGLGPRNCVGMKFAMLEIKLALARLLLKFDVLPSANTPKKLVFEEGPAIRRAKDGIPVIFKKRAST